MARNAGMNIASTVVDVAELLRFCCFLVFLVRTNACADAACVPGSTVKEDMKNANASVALCFSLDAITLDANRMAIQNHATVPNKSANTRNATLTIASKAFSMYLFCAKTSETSTNNACALATANMLS